MVAYLFEGDATFGMASTEGWETLQALHLVIFDDGDQIHVRAGSDSTARFMLMAGAPFKESIVPYGPFVMNTEGEIKQALADLRSGTFVQG